MVLWNGTHTVQLGGTREQRKRPQSEWLRLEAPELKIIFETLWEKVAERRSRNKRAYLRGKSGRLISPPTGEDLRSTYLLSGIAKCVTCGGSIVAIKRASKQHYTRVAYRCAYHHNKRGPTVCINSVEVRQDILDSAILRAINDMLDEQVLEASVVTALERVREEQKKFPDQRVAIERELSLIQTRLHHLVEHIAKGPGRRESSEDLRSRLADIPALFARQVPLARQMLRKLLDDRLSTTPLRKAEHEVIDSLQPVHSTAYRPV